MGFFSFDCKKCGHSLKSSPAWMNYGVAVFRSGEVQCGDYDGYGRLGSVKIPWSYDRPLRNPSVYHWACYVAAGEPGYSGPSRSSRDQGLGRSAMAEPGGRFHSPPCQFSRKMRFLMQPYDPYAC
jgi:hypothetical protein